jgi:flagella basal body P-ring formation protein FlgA
MPHRRASEVTVLAPVATRRHPRGTVLNESDFTVARVALGESPLSPGQSRPGVGWVTRRVVAEGEVLREPAVAPAPAVAAGQPVLFVYNAGLSGLRLSLHGVARSAAALGDRVAVRLGPKRSVAGIVAGPGLVTATDSSSIP